MTAIFIAITISAVFIAGVIGGVVGLVAVAIRREERARTLTEPPRGHATYAARALNGVYVRGPGLPVKRATRARNASLTAAHPATSASVADAKWRRDVRVKFIR
jgi:hypothetical protein